MSIFLGLLVAQLALTDVSGLPEHLVWAQRLVRDLRSEDNLYGSRPTWVQWRGVDGALRTRNRSVCSSFMTAIIRRAYGYGSADIQRWLGLANPQAVHYYNAIATGNRFRPIRVVGMIQPGDVLASRQMKPASVSTGHVMVAATRPSLLDGCRTALCSYRLLVIDSSRSGHGPRDTRAGGGGAGMGTIQLLADRNGWVQAYRWSEQPRSRWRTASEEPLLIGRFCPKGCDLVE